MKKPLTLAISALVLTSVVGCGDEGPNRDDEEFLKSAHASTSTAEPIGLYNASTQTLAFAVTKNGVPVTQSTGQAQIYKWQNGTTVSFNSSGAGAFTADIPGSGGSSTGTTTGGGGTSGGTGVSGAIYTTGGGSSFRVVYTSWGGYYWIYL